MVGMFVNLLAIRLVVDVARCSARWSTSQVDVLGAFDHEELPFERVVEAVNPPRDLSRPIVFQTMFVLNNMRLPT